jgi:hypothetical protein
MQKGKEKKEKEKKGSAPHMGRPAPAVYARALLGRMHARGISI